MNRKTLLLILLPLLAAGCASTAPTARSESPLSSDPSVARERLNHVTASLFPNFTGRRLTASVVSSPAMEAYSWPDGRMTFSTTLIENLTDCELAAAVAHEMGHLLDDRHVQLRSGLRGNPSHPDPEFSADDHAMIILADAGLPSASFETMLRKLECCPRLTPESRQHLRDRMHRLGVRAPS